jgi:hypothetical protein
MPSTQTTSACYTVISLSLLANDIESICIKKRAVEARGSQMANGISSSFYVIVGIKQQRLTKQHHFADPHLKVFFAALGPLKVIRP